MADNDTDTDTPKRDDSNIVVVDGVRYRKEEAPKKATAANKARTTGSGSGSGS